MDAQLKAKWVEALRSGEYKQGTGSFERDGRFCCLGVLCKVAGIDTIVNGNSNWQAVHNLLVETQPLWQMNDGWERSSLRQHSFPEIADYIEENL